MKICTCFLLLVLPIVLAGEPSKGRLRLEIGSTRPGNGDFEDALGVSIGGTWNWNRSGIDLAIDFEREFDDGNPNMTRQTGDLKSYRLGLDYQLVPNRFHLLAGAIWSDISETRAPAFCPPGMACTFRREDSGIGPFVEAYVLLSRYLAPYIRFSGPRTDLDFRDTTLGIRLQLPR